jgi:hypothetical protein
MLPSEEVIMRWVKPPPGAVVRVQTTLAPTSKSMALEVRTEPLVLVALLPVAAALTSRALTGSTPLYSRMRISGEATAALKLKVTTLAPARAATMFLA